VEAGLSSKGFRRSNNDHRYFFYHDLNGQKHPIRTHTSQGRGITLGDPLIAAMAKQSGLNKREFLDLVDCPMDQVTYEHLLRSRGRI
jgi:hypothetical protein